MASVSVFNLTRFTALAAGDVIPVVDISDTSQSAHGSLDSITVTNFFKLVPVTATFGAAALPSALSAAFANQNVFGVTPDVTTNVLRSAIVLCTGYDATPSFYGAQAGGTVSAPTAAIASERLVQVAGMGWDGTAWGTAALVAASVTESTWAVGAHGTELLFQTTAVGAASLVTSLRLRNAANATRLVPAATSISLRNNADNADNLIILDAGPATFRSTVTAVSATFSGSGSFPQISFGANGFGTPTAKNTAAAGETKIDFWEAANQSLRIGMDNQSQMWFASAGTSSGGFAFYTNKADNTNAPAKSFEIDGDGHLGFFAHATQAQQTVTGSRGGNAALASLLTALASYGLIVDGSSA